MTTYQVQDPQGKVHEFEGPEGASPDQILAVAQRQFGHAEAAPAPPASPQDAARTAGMEAGRNENPVTAGVSQAARQATFGGQNYIDAGSRWLGQRLTGVQNPDDFSTDLAYSRGRSEGEVEGHPIASTVGGTAGALMAGGATGAALKGTRFANLLAAQKGKYVANVAKSATAGAAIGGATGLANGDSLPDAARDAAISAIATPVAQRGATIVARAVEPYAAKAASSIGLDFSKLPVASQKAYRALADNISESPQDLYAASQNYEHLTGSKASTAQLMGLKSQGMLRDFAKANPTISEAAMTAADMGGRPLHEQLGAINAQGATIPQTAAELTNLRDTTMNTHMTMPHPQSGLSLNDTPVHDQHGLLLDPRIEYALRPNTQINSRIAAASNGNPAFSNTVLDRLEQNQATIGDLEVVRKALRDTQSQLMRPTAGSPHARDPILAKEFGDLAQRVEGLGVRHDPDYGLALNEYRAGSHYKDAFEHGLNGKAINDVPADDTMLQKSLQSPAGVRGYQHGNALATANQALQAIAPASVRTADGGVGPGHVAQAAMAASSGGLTAIYHGMRSIPVIGARVPEKVQQVIAAQLFNPRTTQQGVANLTRAGVTAKDIRGLGAAIGGVAGQKIADYLSQKGQ